MKIIVNDIDGRTSHTTDSGTPEEVMARSDDRLRAQIQRAMKSPDRRDQETFERDGEEYTVRVVCRD